jgi:uncharacterized protein (DUF58 family)
MRIFRPKNPSSRLSEEASGSQNAEGEGIVRVALGELVRLSRYAEGLPLPAAANCSLRSGQRLSAYQGRGMEFSETRLYQPGDDVRTLDWRVTARTGKAHTKLFREERERPVFLWVDDRAAMHFATRGAFKSVVAARAAALLAWSALAQGDRVGGQIFADERHLEFRPQWSRKSLLRFLQNLTGAPSQTASPSAGVPSIETALERLRRQVRPGSLVFLLSDFRHLDERGQLHLAHLARHSNLGMVYIHDPLESALPPAGCYRLGDGRREISIDTGNQQVVDRYRRRSEERRAALQKLARRHGILWIPCATTDDPLRVLQGELGTRRFGRRAAPETEDPTRGTAPSPPADQGVQP